MKVIRQGIVLWAQFTQDALGVLIDVLEPDWGMPAAVETVERAIHTDMPMTRVAAEQIANLARASISFIDANGRQQWHGYEAASETPDTARPGAW